jgi:hypothetical protein
LREAEKIVVLWKKDAKHSGNWPGKCMPIFSLSNVSKIVFFPIFHSKKCNF